jgi:hypothetical protein
VKEGEEAGVKKIPGGIGTRTINDEDHSAIVVKGSNFSICSICSPQSTLSLSQTLQQVCDHQRPLGLAAIREMDSGSGDGGRIWGYRRADCHLIQRRTGRVWWGQRSNVVTLYF